MNKDILPVLDEISAILKKHDMTGLVVVGNATHCDWRMDLEASWSCAWIETMPDGRHLLRVRSKRSEYADAETQRKKLEATVGNFVTFGDVLKRLAANVDNILVTISRHVDIIGKSTDEADPP